MVNKNIITLLIDFWNPFPKYLLLNRYHYRLPPLTLLNNIIMGNYNNDRRGGGRDSGRGGGGRGGFGGGGGRGGFGGGGGRGGGGRGGYGGGGGRSEMHEATCSECNSRCEVPFKPTRGKDVFCNNCFKKEGDSGYRSDRAEERGGKFGGRDSGRFSRGDSRPEMHQATCAECNSKCEVPFRPTGEKPVFCSDCFGGSRGRRSDSKGSGASDEKIEELSKKLDKILKMLEIIHPKKSFTVSKSEVKESSADEKVKPAKKKAAKKAVAKKTVAKKAPTKKSAAKKKAPAKKKAKK